MILTKDQLDTTVKLLDGRSVTLQENAAPLTIRFAFREALSAMFTDEPNLSFEKKMKRYHIAKKIVDTSPQVEISIEELAELKTCVGKYFYGEPLGFIIDFIEK